MTQPLPSWAADLLRSLEITPVPVRVEQLQHLAATLNHDPGTDELLIGFIAGYAAGMAQGSGMADFDKAHRAAVQFMTKQLDAGE